MANPPRRPRQDARQDPMAAAEAVFRPKQPIVPVVAAPSTPPGARELVSLRIDSAVLEYFQEDGPGWQDRINDALRQAVDAMKAR